MTTIPNRGDFFNRRETRQDSGAHPGARRHSRPDQIPSPAEMAAAWLRRRHHVPQRLAAVVADLAGLGREALS